jgi:hypothetical protein
MGMDWVHHAVTDPLHPAASAIHKAIGHLSEAWIVLPRALQRLLAD